MHLNRVVSHSAYVGALFGRRLALARQFLTFVDADLAILTEAAKTNFQNPSVDYLVVAARWSHILWLSVFEYYDQASPLSQRFINFLKRVKLGDVYPAAELSDRQLLRPRFDSNHQHLQDLAVEELQDINESAYSPSELIQPHVQAQAAKLAEMVVRAKWKSYAKVILLLIAIPVLTAFLWPLLRD